MSSAKVDQTQTYVTMEGSGELARLDPQFPGQFYGHEIRPMGNGLQRTTHHRMTTVEVCLGKPEQIANDSFMILCGSRGVESDELVPQGSNVSAGKSEGTRFSRKWPAQTPGGELRSESDDNELQVVGCLDHFMILTRSEEQDVPGPHVENQVPHSHFRAPSKDQIEFRLGVKVPGTSVGGTVEPCLGPVPRHHGKGLVDGRQQVKGRSTVVLGRPEKSQEMRSEGPIPRPRSLR